jgi:Uma2 family endonuclease
MVTLISKPITYLLTEDDLPSDDDDIMETPRHKYQMDLLLETIYPWLEKRQGGGYAGGNMFIYFSESQVKNKDYKGPDFFAVLNVSNRERKSWVVWQEGKAPDIVIELLSECTAKEDKINKKKIYQDQMRVPEYFWYDPWNPNDFCGFSISGGIYQPLSFDERNRYISERLQLALVRWKGVYRGVETVWLRWETLEGELLPTERESRDEAQAKAQQAQDEAQQAQAKVDQTQIQLNESQKLAQKLAQKLIEMGINPNEI